MILERLQKLQAEIVETGLGHGVLASAAPKTLLIESHTSADQSGTVVFSSVVTEEEITSVSRDLFASGHYNLAVAEAYKAVEKFVASETSLDKSGTTLMEIAFSAKNPRLVWSECGTESERNEQEGYMRIFAGAMRGIRNPVTHEFDWIDNKDDALELLLFAQHLMRKAKSARKK